MTLTPKSNILKRRGVAAPTIMQILPALVRGGVERGTLETAAAIQKHGGRAMLFQEVVQWCATLTGLAHSSRT